MILCRGTIFLLPLLTCIRSTLIGNMKLTRFCLASLKPET